jgi:hypothetical protein
MTKQELLEKMSSFDACEDATRWVESVDGTADEIWVQCERGDWLLWYAAHATTDRKPLALAAALCAEQVLKHVPAGEDRPRLAIEAVRAWSCGEMTVEEVRAATSAAYAAAYAADASASADASADASAAYAAAYAADASAARPSATKAHSLKRSAELVRTIFAGVPR